MFKSHTDTICIFSKCNTKAVVLVDPLSSNSVSHSTAWTSLFSSSYIHLPCSSLPVHCLAVAHLNAGVSLYIRPVRQVQFALCPTSQQAGRKHYLSTPSFCAYWIRPVQGRSLGSFTFKPKWGDYQSMESKLWPVWESHVWSADLITQAGEYPVSKKRWINLAYIKILGQTRSF